MEEVGRHHTVGAFDAFEHESDRDGAARLVDVPQLEVGAVALDEMTEIRHRGFGICRERHAPNDSLTSKYERSRSPLKFRDSTVRNSAVIGTNAESGAVLSVLPNAPDSIRLPQLRTSPRTLKPRNANAPSATIAKPTPSRASDVIGTITFGRISRRMILKFPAPSPRAAVTNSRWLN